MLETVRCLARPSSMRHLQLLAASLLLCSGLCYGQRITFGVKSGVPLTDAFSDQTTQGIDTIVHSFSNSKNYVIGPVIELGLPLGFAVEADALYRPLNLTVDQTQKLAGRVGLFTVPIEVASPRRAERRRS